MLTIIRRSTCTHREHTSASREGRWWDVGACCVRCREERPTLNDGVFSSPHQLRSTDCSHPLRNSWGAQSPQWGWRAAPPPCRCDVVAGVFEGPRSEKARHVSSRWLADRQAGRRAGCSESAIWWKQREVWVQKQCSWLFFFFSPLKASCPSQRCVRTYFSNSNVLGTMSGISVSDDVSRIKRIKPSLSAGMKSLSILCVSVCKLHPFEVVSKNNRI